MIVKKYGQNMDALFDDIKIPCPLIDYCNCCCPYSHLTFVESVVPGRHGTTLRCHIHIIPEMPAYCKKKLFSKDPVFCQQHQRRTVNSEVEQG